MSYRILVRSGSSTCGRGTGSRCWLVIMFYLPVSLSGRMFLLATVSRVISLGRLNLVSLLKVLRWDNCRARHLTLCAIWLDIFNTSLFFPIINGFSHTLCWPAFIISNINSSVPSGRLLTSHLIRFRSWGLKSRFNQILLIIWIWWVVILSGIGIIMRIVKDDIWGKALNYPLML